MHAIGRGGFLSWLKPLPDSAPCFPHWPDLQPRRSSLRSFLWVFFPSAHAFLQRHPSILGGLGRYPRSDWKMTTSTGTADPQPAQQPSPDTNPQRGVFAAIRLGGHKSRLHWDSNLHRSRRRYIPMLPMILSPFPSRPCDHTHRCMEVQLLRNA